MARVTALRPERGGRVLVELDGAPWRALPEQVVVRVGVRAGVEVDRSLARDLARELRGARAIGIATRVLRHRDLTARGLDRRLARAGVRAAERETAIETLGRAGYVDDARFALARARARAARGYGDAAIRFDLEREGVDPGHIEEALASLEPELERSASLVARRGPGPATARFLARRGFGEEAVESAVAERGSGAYD
jgi:regulatory protein